ncbi:MAG: PP2C family protein-serine/threonine phosphatase [Methylocella sp.]
MASHGIYEVGAATHIGCVRELNEDSFLVRPDLGIWAVADGMGGHEAGEAASAALIESLARIKAQQSAASLLQACEDRLIDANANIRELAARRGIDVMGTTVVALLIFDGHYACPWSGDSRAYLVRGSRIHQVTRDHTEVEELVAEGILNDEEARRWPRGNVVTRAMGIFEKPEVAMKCGELFFGDVFVLCSDGLTGHVEPDELKQRVVNGATQTACDALIELALQRGGRDNVTVIVVRYSPNQNQTIVPRDKLRV